MDAERVLVVGPHPVCRFAIVQLIREAGQPLTVAADTATLADAYELVRTTGAGMILLAVGGNEDWSDLEDFVRTVDARTVVLSSHEDGEITFTAVRAGAMGVVPMSLDLPELLTTLRRVAAGEMVIHPSVTRGALLWAAEREDQRHNVQTRYASLTSRERTVLQFLVRGLVAREIAERLYISRRTVEWYLSQIYRKLKVGSRIEAIAEYHRLRGAERRPA